MTELPRIAFLIGAQRTGTTNLAHLLSLHPQIAVSDPKEPLFFTKNWDRGLDWYASRFGSHDRAIALDASTWYSVAPTPMFPTARGASDENLVAVPSRIHSLYPYARFIYVVRNPAVRANSLFWMLHREHPGYRRFGSLREAMESDPFILRGSDYVGQIQHFLEHFAQEKFLILVFEEMIRDLPATLKQCFSFLEVDPRATDIDTNLSKRNESFRYTPFGQFLSTILGSSENLERVRRRIPDQETSALGRWIHRRLRAPIPPISDEDKAFIQDLFRDQNRRLEAILGKTLVDWNL